ncbi:hypothetical protein [Pelagicoccus sp. SDUM812003]|uniref:carboxylesterase family protein n=1 Tax=Pelagicoccus sp. SDUM812003 TaxID=3041267 RepID=UPI00280D966A|nr:hypothetical protein [Pelagicoccus sp. SDUM812003]MDQ8202938.1 hypothetical protein [Pelagicoccus sp. SDUM812003]
MIRYLICFSLSLVVSVSSVSGQQASLVESAEALLEQEDLGPYRGWLKYLIFDATVVAERKGVDAAQAEAKRERLESWIQTLKTNPNVIDDLRGVQEWAYESEVDGSGQPFMINIPQDYDPSIATPLSLYMHGLAGNHSEHYSGSDQLEGIIEVSVLGRSRGGGYVALSEADVMSVLNYVQTFWNVDPDQIHILGGSMGGSGTLRLGSRYPHLFASARPTCAFAGDKPYGNLLTLPIYAIHSDDDFVVPILQSRGPLERLREQGGEVIFDETTGYGHASWDYAEGGARAAKWFREQTRPDSRSVTHLDYTAFDGVATRSWWAEIAKWGKEPKPATFVLKAGDDNRLYATLNNVSRLKLRIGESPFDATRRLAVSVNGAVPIELEAPLPRTVYLTADEGSWKLDTTVPETEVRDHTPGGPNLLYNGEPLLIVYGTQGSEKENTAMLAAAKVAAKNSDARWSSPQYGAAWDEIAHSALLYGDLVIRKDVDLTDMDIRDHHLVLIGTARQNSVVARLADRLPVSISETKIEFSDGETYAADGLGLGLVHYNPESPQKLVYWVASNDPGLYRADSPVPSQMTSVFGGLGSMVAPGFGCLISKVEHATLVAGRSFDADWQWLPRNETEPVVAASIKSARDFKLEIEKALRVAMATDFSFAGETMVDGSSESPVLGGVTRLSDFANRFFYEPIGVMELDGVELLEMQSKLASKGQSFYPKPSTSDVDPKSRYRVAVPEASLWILVPAAEHAPKDYRLTDMQLSTVVERFFPTE